MNFVAIFLKVSITRRVRTKRYDNFYFLSFSAFSNLFWLEWSHKGIYYFYGFCCYFLGIFNYGSGRNGSEQYFLFSVFFTLLLRILDWKDPIMVFFNFFAMFLEFYVMRRVRMKRKDNFCFLPVSSFSSLFLLGMKPSWYFLLFWIFLLFSWNFLLRVG